MTSEALRKGQETLVRVAVLALLVPVLPSVSPGQSKFLNSYQPAEQIGRLLPNIPSNSISHVAVQGTSLWIGTGKGLARSRDGGRTWESFDGDPAFADPSIFSIGVLGDTVWAATGFTKEVQGSSVQTGSGYAASVTDGRTWTHVGQPLDGRGDSLVAYGITTAIFLPIVVPEQNVSFDVSLRPGAVWVASWSSGLRKSTNRGATWERIVLPARDRNTIAPTDSLGTYRIDPRKDNNYLAFSVFPQSDSIIWAGTAGGVNSSTDGGRSWKKYTRYNQAAPIAGDWVIAIAGQPLPAGTRVWTTNWPAEGPDQGYAVSVTDDRGRTWSSFLPGVKAYGFAFRDSIVYVASDLGLYRSADGGKSWLQSGVITDRTGQVRLASPAFYAVGVVGDTLYAGCNLGLLKTIDDGQRPFGQEWEVLRTAQPLTQVTATYAYPNPFSPTTESVRIRYQAVPGASVTLEIFDFGMNRVRTVVRDAVRSGSGEVDEVWDGRSDGGQRVKNGVYFYRVTVSGRDASWGKILVLQ